MPNGGGWVVSKPILVISLKPKSRLIKRKSVVVISVVIRYYKRKVLQITRRLYMKKSNTLAISATRNLHLREILLNTKGQYMKK